jgi:vacuolar-type H+-ATPase subunit I/STV1
MRLSDASTTIRSASLAHMDRITPHVREEHLEQIRSVQESADSDISEAEAVRRIFDRASEANRTDEELEAVRSEYESKIDALRSEHESELEAVQSECGSRIEDLERDVERLRNEKRTLINDREERTELVGYVQEERSLTKQKAQAGIVTRARWWLTGMPAEGE